MQRDYNRRKSEKKAGTNFALLSWPRNIIGWFMKTYSDKPIKILQFLSRGKIQKCLKATEHEYIFSEYSRNVNISEIFWSCYTKNNFPIICPKNLIFWRQSKFRMRGPQTKSHVTIQYRVHVTNKKRYISTFTRLMNPKLSRVVS